MTRAPVKTTGKLRIGDQWNAINIIARSQTHPLKAVCEFVENAIDARSADVHILRSRKRGQAFLEIRDDGTGIPLGEDGVPDFARIATHICDSMKRHLDADHRVGVHGEFGIGLLSFWSLGEQIRIASADQQGRLYEMTMSSGSRTYTVRPLRGHLDTGGTRIVIGPLIESTRSIVTGEKLQRYLSVELRDRIRNSGVRVRITDRISRKDLIVQPRQFEGELLDEAKNIATSFGDVTVELYLQNANIADSGVAVCKDGTRVLKSIAELDAFQHAPWTDSRLVGVIDFPVLNLAPGTRSGIVPDDRLQAFVEAVTEIEPVVAEAIAVRERADSEKASRQTLKQLHKAFVDAIRELPENEYLFFDIPKPSAKAGKRNGHGADGSSRISSCGLPIPAILAGAAELTEEEAITLPLEPGALSSVTITPRHARRRPGQVCLLRAKPRDENAIVIHHGIDFAWRIVAGDGTLVHADAAACSLESNRLGEVTVEVRAAQADCVATDQVVVRFLENAPTEDNDASKGLPSYRLEADPGKAWRSRYDLKANEITINSAHRDFLASRSTGAKHRRYIGKLYAKEVVLMNFPHESPEGVMERLIEVLLRTEDAL